LSGGQKQRVGIARALANDPKVLLCDEATSALDPQTTKSILRLLKELNKKLDLTIVIITHEMQVVKEVCTRVAVMENGRVAEEGNIFKVFSEPKEDITKSFIESTSVLTNINYLIEDKSSVVEIREDEKILKLKYLENSTTEPIISIISREFNVDANIIFGNIEIIQDAPLGGLIVIIRGQEDKLRNVIKYLEKNNVEVEVIMDGRVSTKVIA
jgi:D-methionine transport system ATP-binding protein